MQIPHFTLDYTAGMTTLEISAPSISLFGLAPVMYGAAAS